MKVLESIALTCKATGLALSTTLCSTLGAATLVWDGNPSTAGIQDASGSWVTTGASAWVDTSTSEAQAWNNEEAYVAKFGSGPSSTQTYTVTLGGPVSAGGLVFGSVGTAE